MTTPFSSVAGYLELILGPMFSGKTTRLIERYRAYTYIGKSVVVVNYSLDRRYSSTMLSSHDRVQIPCIFADSLMETANMNMVIDADVVLINEGQFFADLVPAVHMMINQHRKHVYVCGLDGDFRRERFGTILDLIPTFRSIHAVLHFLGDQVLHFAQGLPGRYRVLAAVGRTGLRVDANILLIETLDTCTR